MVLAKFAEYERRSAQVKGETRPVGYEERPVRWIVELDRQGCPVGGSLRLALTPLSGGAPKRGRGRDRGKPMLVPTIRRQSNTAPALLVDDAEYVLGLPRKADNPERAAKRHKALVELVESCAAATREHAVQAVAHFLRDLDPSTLAGQLPEDFDPNDLVAFQVDSQFVTDLPSVQNFWAQRFQQAAQVSARMRKKGNGGTDHAAQGLVAQCLVCGQEAPIARTHPLPIRGVPGGQASLVSFNAEAFESYGLGQSYNAPVCVPCAQEYARGLNRLLGDEATRLRVGGIAYAFWTRDPSDEPGRFARILGAPKPEDVQALLETPWAGGAARTRPQRVGRHANAFYATALSSHQGRIVLLTWLETPVDEAVQNLTRYVRFQTIPRLSDNQTPFFSVNQLVSSLLPRKQRRPGREAAEPDARAVVELVRIALKGGALPDWLLYQAVRRNHAEQDVTPARAALIKLVIQSQQPEESIDKEGSLNTATQQSSAFLCGRLLAILERAQQQAVHPRATLVDRFYGSASSAPCSVFGTLLRNAQAHLGKLRREKEEVYRGIQTDLEEVLSGIGPHFPPTLDLKKQAEFALGYYYQRARRGGGSEETSDVQTA